MIIWKGYGNILAQKATILCPINAAGAMGAGLAKDVRDQWPEVYQAYRGIYAPGISPHQDMYERARIITPVRTKDGHSVLLVCSKNHWRQPADMKLIEDNLTTISKEWQNWGLTELATPLLGSGLGQLSRDNVERKIQRILGGKCRLPVRLFLGLQYEDVGRSDS
jgi:hypothetical protein